MGGALTLEQIINFLLGAQMFGDLSAAELSQIVHILQIRFVREGQVVFREGQPGDAWYVVFQGGVEVFTEAEDGSERVYDNLGPGSCFGEMAILDGSSRSASVRAVEPSTLFRFPRVDFNKLLESDNLAAYKLVYHMALLLVRRQRQSNTRLVEALRHRDDDEEDEESLEDPDTE